MPPERLPETRWRGPPRRPERWRRPVLVVLLLASFAALVASLAYEGEPPADVVHTHSAFRVYADDRWIRFPLHNFAVRHPDVHIETDPIAELRAEEVLHVHRKGLTLGDFLRSLALDVAPGHLRLDAPESFARAVHDGEVYADDADRHWRLYVQPLNGTWTRARGNPVDLGAWPLGAAERILLTYGARERPDDDPDILAEQASLVDDLWRWPQVGR